ncbi:MAG: hydroxymethylbilane synthase [Legionella sp.]|nr:hydroxymethylbilane synthase [Legionella sp.]
MPDDLLRIATRKSPLALWQANYVGELIKHHWPEMRIELVPMLTSGDKFLKDKLQAIGGKGLFVKELEEALLDGRADLAVHSMKDVPAQLPNGLNITAICERDNPLDAFVSPFNLTALPKGGIVGTTSLRRQSQLLALRPDIVIKPLRGNINTRLDKLKKGEFDAIILAAAGLFRMGMANHIKEILGEEIMLPACGQGALGIECRNDDVKLQQILTPLNDSISAICVNAERHVNGLLGGNCHVPLAVFCTLNANNQLFLRAKLLTVDGKMMITDEQTGTLADAMQLAEKCALNMLANGARELLELI